MLTAGDGADHIFSVSAGSDGHTLVQDLPSGLVIDALNIEEFGFVGGGGNDRLEVIAGDDANHVFTVLASVDEPAAGENKHVLVHDNTAGGIAVVVDVVGVEEIVVFGGAGDDTLTVGDLSGTDIANDTIVFAGGGGNDVLDATLANVRVDAFGEAGNDTLATGSGNDSLLGGTGNDTLERRRRQRRVLRSDGRRQRHDRRRRGLRCRRRDGRRRRQSRVHDRRRR